MGSWPKDELQRVAEADDLRISPFREDGVTDIVVERGDEGVARIQS
jgi:hypothetical protein